MNTVTGNVLCHTLMVLKCERTLFHPFIIYGIESVERMREITKEREHVFYSTGK